MIWYEWLFIAVFVAVECLDLHVPVIRALRGVRS